MQHCLKLGLVVDLDVQVPQELPWSAGRDPEFMVKGICKYTFSDVQKYKKLGNQNTRRLVKFHVVRNKFQ